MTDQQCRAFVRVPLEVEVELESEHNFYSGVTGDVSEGGLFVATYEIPPVGEVLELVLRLPGEPEAFTVRGTVRWVRDLRAVGDGAPSGFGMEWLSLSPRALRAVRRFTDHRDSILFDAA